MNRSESARQWQCGFPLAERVGVILAGHRRKGGSKDKRDGIGLETPGCLFNLISI